MTESKCKTPLRDKNADMMINGKISAAVWYLAWPMIINTVIQSSYNLINRLFLGGLPNSDACQAAIGVSMPILHAQIALSAGLSVGVSALTSRFLGAQENKDADEATRQSLILSVAVGIMFSVAMVIFGAPLAKLVGAQSDVLPLARTYLIVIGLGSVPLYLSAVVTSALRSTGDVRSVLYAGIATLGLNALLDWLLIMGPGPFPELGLTGAAIATNISRVVGLVVVIAFLRKSVLRKALHHFTPHFQWFWRILRIGLPASVPSLLWASSYGMYINLIKQLPDVTATQAALTVGMTIESMCFMPGIAYSMAIAPLVGQNIGAGKIKRAEKCAWTAAGHAAAIMAVVSLPLVLFPNALAAPFTDKASVAALIASYLTIVAFREPFMATGLVLIGAMQGAGETRVPTVIEFVVNWPIRLGLAWLLAIKLGYGAKGMWISMAVPSVLYGILCAAWFKWGTWKSSSV